MTAPTARVRTGSELLDANQRFYDEVWTDARLVEPERFNTWPLVSELVAGASLRLEVAPGLRPRLPIAGTHFIERERAMRWYNRLMPIIVRFGKKLVFAPGAIDMCDADEVLLVCRRQPGART